MFDLFIQLMRFGSGRTGLLQDSTTGSIIVTQDGHQDDSIQMQSLSEGIINNKHILLIYKKNLASKTKANENYN